MLAGDEGFRREIIFLFQFMNIYIYIYIYVIIHVYQCEKLIQDRLSGIIFFQG